MSLTLLRPTSTSYQSMPGGTAHTVLADDSDATYLTAASPGHNAGVEVADFVLPSGAVVKNVAAWIRQSIDGPVQGSTPSFVVEIRDGALNVLTSQVFAASASPTTYAMNPLNGPLTVAQINAMIWGAYAQVAGGRVQEAYLAVTYVVPAQISLVGPSGTLTTTNRPTVQWKIDLIDSVGGDQAEWSAAIYQGATLISQSGWRAGSADRTWAVPDPLADGSYTAQTTIAQTVNGQRHLSNTASSAFTVNVDLPATPTVALTAQSLEGRVRINLSDNAGAATTDAYDLERSSDGVTWLPVRTADGSDGRTTAADPIIYDYEAPNGVGLTYRARAVHDYGAGSYAVSAWVTSTITWSSTQWWIKHPLTPALNVPVELFSYSEIAEEARMAAIQPLGATLAVVVSDTNQGEAGTVVVQCRTTTALDDLKAVLRTVDTLLLQGPTADGHPDRYVRFGTRSSSRVIDKGWSHITRESLTWTLVAAPAGAQTGSQYTAPAGLVLDGGSASTTTFDSTVDGGPA